jgi:uncharacterized membrane protein
MEVTCKLIEKKKFINRGFLIGPICPIYGYGVLGIIILIGKNTKDVLSVFLKAILICSILEYLTSYFMEKIFKARWWDYSQRKYNINGRICLETMIPFGILGCLIIYIIHPIITKIVSPLNFKTKIILAIILLIAYIIDNIISLNIMNKIKKQIKKQKVDNTELINKKIKDWLTSNSILYRHIKEAYPKFKIKQKEREKNDKHS